jgi:hypothetical protein
MPTEVIQFDYHYTVLVDENIRVGSGMNFSPYFGAMLDFGYDSMRVNSTILNNLGFGGGRLSVFP